MGGLIFMDNDKMCVRILRDDLMARIDPEVHESALQRKGCREMDFTGRPMKGFVFIETGALGTAGQLRNWVSMARSFAQGLPRKHSTASRRLPKLAAKERHA